MSNYRDKLKEFSVMELGRFAQVGVRVKRARVADSVEEDSRNSDTNKKNKARNGDKELEISSSTLVQLKSCRRVASNPENSVSTATSENSGTWKEDSCSFRTSDHGLESCCSSTGSSDLGKGSLKSVDLQEETLEIVSPDYNCKHRERRERTPTSERQSGSSKLAKPSEESRRHRIPAEKMPSESELEHFFAAAEENLQKRFKEKYNYDIANDVPLEGRFEWLPLKP